VTQRLWKVTSEDGSSCHGGSGRYSLGVWREVAGPLVACAHGIHLCRDGDLLSWLGPVIWEAEADGETIEQADKVVARRARVIRRTAWDERSARLFAADCADRVLHLFESARPGDDRPRRAIEVARMFAEGMATDASRAAAWDAAGAAAGDAAWATWAAAYAAWDAARAAAGAAAGDAAWATWAAAHAARAAAGAAAWDAERGWQTARLLEVLT